MSFSIVNHRLEGDNVRPPDDSLRFKGWMIPRYIVAHYTAGTTVESTISSLKKDSASYHLIIDREGVIWNMGKLTKKGAHSGRSNWKGRHEVNNVGIGISMANLGSGVVGHGTPSTSKVHKNYRGGTAKPFENYTDVQRQVFRAVCRTLCEKYSSIRNVIGHDDVSVGRRDDPGPLFEEELRNLRDELSSEGHLKLDSEKKKFLRIVSPVNEGDSAPLYMDYNFAKKAEDVQAGSQISILSQVYRYKPVKLLNRFAVSFDGINLAGFMRGRDLDI